MKDVRLMVDGYGSVVLVRPQTEEAKAWVEENVETESWQWMGGSFAVHPRELDNLVKGMREAGLTVGR